MTKIQLGSGSSSATTHRITQPSSTLNRRYVNRPSNLIIEEAAQRTAIDSDQGVAAPSRLVNLRLHAADLEQASESAPQLEPTQDTPITSRIIELGTTDGLTSAEFSQIVPAEAAPDEPVVTETALVVQPSYDTMTVSETTVVTAPMSPEDAEALAMNIAADYAAASMNSLAPSTPSTMSIAAVSSNSIDSIAQAASEAIASIRMATDPDEIAEQISSLQSFADNIRANSAAPEMIELSDTIEKFISVAMKSSKIQAEVERKTSAKRASESKPKVSAKTTAKKTSASSLPAATTKPTPRSTAGRTRVAAPTRPVAKRAARKTARKPLTNTDQDQALRKALRSVSVMDDEPAPKVSSRRSVAKKTSGKRFVIAFLCAAACVAAIVYFVGSSIPDISVKVAAMQTGIEASYPSYIPREYSLSDISSEEGRIVLVFKGPDKTSFTLSEEKSSWDSTTLLRNFVEPTWQENYITTHEQGVTIYISGANAAWVNGGVLYKIEASSNSLTKKQLRNIVTSL